jgi:hypothetical protein
MTSPDSADRSTAVPRTHTLSKSDFKLARSCPSKLYYRELRYPDVLAEDEYLAFLAEGGYMVEALAKQLFPGGITLEYGKSPQQDYETTRAHLDAAPTVTLFEATLFDGQRLARVDVLKRSPAGFDLYEVKSSSFDPEDATKRFDKTGSYFKNMTKPFAINAKWRDYLEDVTYQVALLKDLFPGVPVRAHLILMNKHSVAAHDGMPSWVRVRRSEDGRLHSAEFVGDAEAVRRDPLTIGLNVSDEVAELEREVRDATDMFLGSLTPQLTRLAAPLGGHCKSCEFRVAPEESRNGFLECWGDRGRVAPHVLDLYRGGALVDTLIENGVDHLHEITEEHFGGKSGVYAERQRIQVAQSRKNAEWFDPALHEAMTTARYPLHFVDFEAATIAVPHHKGMGPYGQLAFQWSCHTQSAPGATLEHRAFLHRDDRWPNEAFARTLREALGDAGTILVWSDFERTVMNRVAGELTTLGSGDAALAEWLTVAARKPGEDGARMLDMLKLCRAFYYHPGMGGSNSIKMVLDALWKSSESVRARFTELAGREGDPLRGPYATLPPSLIEDSEETVNEGTGAMRAYFAMAYGAEKDDPNAKEKWANLLLEYCKLDTLAMVLIWEHWERLRGRAAGSG